MKATLIFTAIVAAVCAAPAATCSKQSTQVTFYGSPDNDPKGSTQVAYQCDAVKSRGFNAGGDGSYGNPLTFATADGEFKSCEIIYAPYLKKYLIHQDLCAQCATDWKSKKWHIDIWTGDKTNGGQNQINCENSLTPDGNQVIIRNPANNLEVDKNPTFSNGQCHTDQTFKNNDPSKYCKS